VIHSQPERMIKIRREFFFVYCEKTVCEQQCSVAYKGYICHTFFTLNVIWKWWCNTVTRVNEYLGLTCKRVTGKLFWTLSTVWGIFDIHDVTGVRPTSVVRWLSLYRVRSRPLSLIVQKCQYNNNQSPKDGSTANYRNVVCTKRT
jgi:hypothetical protein